MIYITSDCHFSHKNIIKYEPESRGQFTDINEMNETLVANWNSVVKPEDTIYVVGDFFMGPLTSIEPILSRLHGRIILVRGNHDTEPRINLYRQHGIEVKDIAYINYKGKFFTLCHFPYDSAEFAKMVSANNEECIFLYGHIHSNAPQGFVNNTYHIGVDTNNLTPISIEQIWRASNNQL